MDNQLVYDRKIAENFNDLHVEHQQVLKWVGNEKKVLETACHTGYISAWLKRQRCSVTGAEIYEPALNKAKPFLEKWVLGDIEQEKIWGELASEKYDVVMYMHILEHLVDPEKILKKTKLILKPGGKIIICLPNVSNWFERWNMFKGNFNYTEDGVMDRTHLHFYNFYTAKSLIEGCGYRIEEYSGISWKIKFRILPRKKVFESINTFYNNVIHKFSSPNVTDRVLMFKISFD